MTVCNRLTSCLCCICRDVEHAADSFCVISCARIGHHFNILDETCRHHLEYHRRIAGNHRVRLSVHIDLEAAASVDGDVVLTVHRHHRNFAEHVQHSTGLGIHIILHLICQLVHFHYDKGLLGGYRAGFKGLYVVLDKDITEIKGLLSFNGEADAFLLSTHIAEKQSVAALAGECLREVAFLSGSRICYRLRKILIVEKLNYC